MKKLKVYMAGPLFSAGDIRQRIYEAEKIEQLKAHFAEKGLELEVFSPINAPVNDKEANLPTAEDIYKFDYQELMSSDVVFADLAYYDAGVMMELGLILNKSNVEVYAYDNDLRVSTAGNYEGLRIPYGVNQFVIGGLLVEKTGVETSFELALDKFKNSK